MTLLSVFGGGLWFIPLLTGLGAAYSAYRGIKVSKAGTVGGSKLPFYKTGAGVFSIFLTLATIGIIILMVNDK